MPWYHSLKPRRRAGKVIAYVVDLHYPDGKRERVTIADGEATQADAEQKYIDWVDRALPLIKQQFGMDRAEGDLDKRDPKIARVIDYYLHVALVAKGAKVHTLAQYETQFREFEQYCRDNRIGRVSQLTREHVDRHLAELSKRLSPASIKNRMGIIRSMLNAAVDANMLDASPVKKWLAPNVPDAEISPLEPDELRRLLECVRTEEPVYYNYISWIAGTGNRPSDARALRWRQIDLRAMTVERTQVKTARLARYQVSGIAFDALMREKKRGRPGPDGEVFTNRRGEPFSKNSPLWAIQRAARAAKIGRVVTLKDLRHTFGYIMANHAGCPLPVLQVLMGHTDIHMTMRYVRPTDAFPALDRMTELVAKSTFSKST
ncbi:MAG: hypothetical protein AMXMBFR84_37400 [Candidatus Hydrogenedentota bacterium]